MKGKIINKSDLMGIAQYIIVNIVLEVAKRMVFPDFNSTLIIRCAGIILIMLAFIYSVIERRLSLGLFYGKAQNSGNPWIRYKKH